MAVQCVCKVETIHMPNVQFFFFRPRYSRHRQMKEEKEGAEEEGAFMVAVILAGRKHRVARTDAGRFSSSRI